MKAVQFIKANNALELRNVPKPTPGKNEVLIKIKAAGICHSDAHYRRGTSKVGKVPVTLGHEVAGVIEEVGSEVSKSKVGERVCVHYLVTCGKCKFCKSGDEQFCVEGQMIGNRLDGGYAEYIAVPERNAVPLPEEITFEQGATLMCASATSYHALRKSRITEGETVAVFGAGGLGQSAIQLATIMGTSKVFAIDINDKKLDLARQYGAIPINSKKENPVEAISKQNGGVGVDIALELIGLPLTQIQAVKSCGPLGRAVMVGLSDTPVELDIYTDVLGKEKEIIGSNDHLLGELSQLIEYAKTGRLDISKIVAQTIPLNAEKINAVLDGLDSFKSGVRTVIAP